MPSIQHELIPISKRGEQEQWVDTRTLHLFLESKQEFANWIKNRIDDFSFIEGRDFLISLSKSTGGRNAKPVRKEEKGAGDIHINGFW